MIDNAFVLVEPEKIQRIHVYSIVLHKIIHINAVFCMHMSSRIYRIFTVQVELYSRNEASHEEKSIPRCSTL